MPKRFQQNLLLPTQFTWHHAWLTSNKFQQYCILQVCPFTGLNTCFLLCFSSTTFSAVEILWNMRIGWLKWLSSSFATFDKELDTRCFPLSDNLSKVESELEPDPPVPCDLPVCPASSVQDIQVLACFHSFHVTCLPADGCCRISCSSFGSPKHQATQAATEESHQSAQHSLY